MKTTEQKIKELEAKISMGLCGAPGSRYEMEAKQALAQLKKAA